MPTPVVMACSDQEALRVWSVALQDAGERVTTFTDPYAVLDALEAAATIRVLVTCLDFGKGKPTGIALARMARYKRPDVRVIFAGSGEYQIHAAGLGDFKVEPVQPREIVDSVQAMLREADGRQQ